MVAGAAADTTVVVAMATVDMDTADTVDVPDTAADVRATAGDSVGDPDMVADTPVERMAVAILDTAVDGLVDLVADGPAADSVAADTLAVDSAGVAATSVAAVDMPVAVDTAVDTGKLHRS